MTARHINSQCILDLHTTLTGGCSFLDMTLSLLLPPVSRTLRGGGGSGTCDSTHTIPGGERERLVHRHAYERTPDTSKAKVSHPPLSRTKEAPYIQGPPHLGNNTQQ